MTATRPNRPRPGRAAVVQDWFFHPGGSENVAWEIADLLQAPDVYTSFAEAPSISRFGSALHPWPLQRLFGPTRRYRSFLPLYPMWFGSLDLRRYDLVISSSSAFAKAVRTRADAIHVAYIHTPMRYAWDLDGYLAGASVSLPGRIGARVLRPMLRGWDRRTASRPDVLVANSLAVRGRIRRVWGRDAEVIHPPVDVDTIVPSTRDDGYLLVVARLLAYRRIDLAVEAATRLGRPLVVVGDGPERRRLASIAGPSVRFMPTVDRPTLLDLVSRCHAYVVPGEEDFGIAPVEAMAAGKAVIALRAGGALETVVEGTTGVFFDRPSAKALADAVGAFDVHTFDPAVVRANAERFGADVFRAKFRALLLGLGVAPELLRQATDAGLS